MQRLRGTVSNKLAIKMALDAIAIFFSFILALALRFEFAIPDIYLSHFMPLVPAIVLIYLVVNYAIRLYARRWKYASFDELAALVSASVLSTVIVLIVVVAIPGVRKYVPVSVVLIGGVLSLFSMAFVRLQFRLLSERQMRKGMQGGTKVLLVGAGEAGEMVVRDILRHPEHDYTPVGFIDDDPRKQNLVIQGVRVLGTSAEIAKIFNKYAFDEVFITIPSARGAKIEEIVHSCEATGAKIKILPGIYLTMAGEVGVDSVRELRLEDLLGREPVETDLDSITAYVTDKVVLVTGAGGSIGSELSRQLCRLGPRKLLALDHDSTSLYELDMSLSNGNGGCPLEIIVANIRDAGRVESIFKRYKPQVVFHSAALKHVPMMESNPSEAVKNNVQGTRNLVQAGVKHKVERFILISTDKAVNPVSVMGATKRVAELLIQNYEGNNGIHLAAVRFGNVLGSRGSVVPLFKRQIEEGGPILVTHPEVTRYFMTISEAAQLVMQAGAYTEGGDVFILDMGEPVRIVDLARKMVRLLGNGDSESIEIRITGLRPGEKLHEQLVLPSEEMIPTRHPKITKAVQGNGRLEDFDDRLDALIRSAETDDDRNLKDLLLRMVDGAASSDEGQPRPWVATDEVSARGGV